MNVPLLTADSQSSTSTAFDRLNLERSASIDLIDSDDSLELPSIRPKPRKSRAFTMDEHYETSSTKKLRKENSTSSTAEYKDLFTENMLKQSENHQLHHEVLQIQKDKLQVELDRAKLDLDTARTLAAIEINKQKELAALELEKKKKDLNQ